MFRYDLLDKYEVHYVEDSLYGGYKNIHTHGLPEHFGHMDIQLVLPYDPEDVAILMNETVNKIDHGQVFRPGEKYHGLFTTCDVEFIEFNESGRTVLRMLLPDEDCISPFQKACDKAFRRQLIFDPTGGQDGSINRVQ